MRRRNWKLWDFEVRGSIKEEFEFQFLGVTSSITQSRRLVWVEDVVAGIANWEGGNTYTDFGSWLHEEIMSI